MASFRFTLPVPFRLDAVVRSHGWIELAPWRWEAGRLSRPERIGRAVGELAIRQPHPDRLQVAWRGRDGAPAPARRAIEAVVARALSWDWDHAPFLAVAAGLDPAVGALVAGGGGRFIRGTRFYEDFAKTICTINTSWASTRRMADALVTRVGRGLFPTPKQVLAYGEAALRQDCRLGFRAATLFRGTQRLLADRAVDGRGDGSEDRLSYDYLTSLFGIGPYAAAHCRVLLHDFSRLPVDSEVTAHLRDALGLSDDAFAAHFARWGDYCFLGYKLRRIAAKLAATDA